MGRQLNFWMTETDEWAFIERLARDDALWTPYALPLGARPAPHELAQWTPDDESQRRVIIRRADWSDLRIADIAEKPLPDFRPDSFTPWTMVGGQASPAFRWSTCARGPGVIRRGRIYLPTAYFDGCRTHRQPADVTRWFASLTAWLRRRGVKGKYRGEYVMPDAARKVTAGAIYVRI